MLRFFLILTIIFSLKVSFAFIPGDQAISFSLKTLDGSFEYDPEKNQAPIFFHAYDAASGFNNALWTKQDSFEDLLLRSSLNAHFIFASYSESSSKLEVTQLQQNLFKTMKTLNFSERVQNQFKSRLHFAVDSVSQLTWISRLLANWTQELDQLWIFLDNSKTLYSKIKRLDARYDWLPYFDRTFGDQILPLALFGEACGEPPIQNVSKKLALISRSGPSSNCDFFTKVQNAMKQNAIGIIVYTTEDQPLVDMNCVGTECNVYSSIPGTMIPYSDGQNLVSLLKDGRNIYIQVKDLNTNGYFFCIDGQNLLQEAGWMKYPSMIFFAWQSQYLDSQTRLLKIIQEKENSSSSLIIPIFTNTKIYNSQQPTSVVSFPSFDILSRFENLDIEMRLFCDGDFDTICPIWDRILSMTITCDNKTTYEIARWITPFRRRVGHWITSLNSFLPLVSGLVCQFSMNGIIDAQAWVVNSSFIFSNPKKEPKLVPYRFMDLFHGGTFDKHYNDNYKPISFSIDENTVKLELVVIISGHGSDNNNCCEFCVTSHHFILNSIQPHVITFSEAGTPMGCADRVSEGMISNQHGTFLYGRSGWCDGLPVKPWIIDLTGELSPGINSLQYYGTFNGSFPNPTQSPGYIDLTSYLVFWQWQ